MTSLRVGTETVWLHRFERDALRPPDLGEWWSVTRTGAELSVVSEQSELAGAQERSGSYRVLQVQGPIDHYTSGVVAGVSRPLAEAGISIFAISTFDACHILVPAERLDEALDALLATGWVVDT